MRGPLAAVLGVAVVLGPSCGVLGDSEEARDEPPTAVQIDVGEVLDLTPGCRRDLCRVVERRDGFRYDGRRVALLAVAHPETCEDGQRTSLHLAAGEEVLWSSKPSMCGDAVRGIETDATGHAFLTFAGPNRAQTVVVLRVSGKTVEDFGSLGGAYTGRPAGSPDEDGDGAKEIVAGERTWKWTGSGYEEADDG